MKTIKLSEASRSLAEYARELDDDIVLVTDRNRPIAPRERPHNRRAAWRGKARRSA